MDVQVVTCDQCGHILAEVLDDGRIEVKHRGMVVRAPYCDAVCPRCGRPKLDVGKVENEKALLTRLAFRL